MNRSLRTVFFLLMSGYNKEKEDNPLMRKKTIGSEGLSLSFRRICGQALVCQSKIADRILERERNKPGQVSFLFCSSN